MALVLASSEKASLGHGKGEDTAKGFGAGKSPALRPNNTKPSAAVEPAAARIAPWR